jgi:hypothetical protein
MLFVALFVARFSNAKITTQNSTLTKTNLASLALGVLDY